MARWPDAIHAGHGHATSYRPAASHVVSRLVARWLRQSRVSCALHQICPKLYPALRVGGFDNDFQRAAGDISDVFGYRRLVSVPAVGPGFHTDRVQRDARNLRSRKDLALLAAGISLCL